MRTKSGGLSSAIVAAPSLQRGETHPSLAAVQDHLRRFGYVTGTLRSRGRLDETTSDALALYQSHNGLAVTGTFDEATRARMAVARCGVTDMVRGVAFSTTCPWTHPCLTFAFDSGTDAVPGGGEFAAVRRALASWAAATPLTFTEVRLNEHPDLIIGWRPGDDPDFDLSSDIAHADFPPGCGVIEPDSVPKPVHFRETGINWSDDTPIFSFDVERPRSMSSVTSSRWVTPPARTP